MPGFAGLLAGIVVAALDRQHPWDLFDAKRLPAAKGNTGKSWSTSLAQPALPPRTFLTVPYADFTRESALPLCMAR